MLPYNSYDTTGAVTTAGSYAFLMPDEDSTEEGATTAVETYGEMRRSATMLVVNETDGDGFDQSAALDTAQVGDVLQWGQGRTCWTRYKVMSAPEPAEGSSVRRFGVEWHMYSFAGCSGDVDATAPTTFNLKPEDYRMSGRPEPIMYGPWQLHGYGWTGVLDPSLSDLDAPDVLIGSSPFSQDVATVKQHRLWRNPVVPDDWELGSVEQGFEYMDGYIANYGNSLDAGATIQIRRLYVTPYRRAELAEREDYVVIETRELDGLPAYVEYTTNRPRFRAVLRAYDAAIDVEYLVIGEGNLDLDQVIAIARSLWASD